MLILSPNVEEKIVPPATIKQAVLICFLEFFHRNPVTLLIIHMFLPILEVRCQISSSRKS